MHHFRQLKQVNFRQSWLTIGIFDGVHIGHQAIIKDMVQEASLAGVSTGVVTFYPHPVEVIHGISESIYLTSPDQRAELISLLGVDYVLTLQFDRSLANQSAEEFIQSLNRQIGVKGLWVGNDFVLGKNREGTINLIMTLGGQMGYTVKEMPKITVDGKFVSSSQIRQHILLGEISQANKMLGRFYSLNGKVIKGIGRGKSLGIPTANIETWEKQILPPNGVYATLISFDQQRFQSVTNVGLKPTFIDNPAKPIVETHIFDFEENIYEKMLTLEFVEYLRKEVPFPNPQELINQIRLDIQRTKEVLSHEP